MRSPFTGVIFALELTHDVNVLAAAADRGDVSRTRSPCCVLRRSILTEKVSRRGFHLTREYAIDPLEILFVREVMSPDVVGAPAGRLTRRDSPQATTGKQRDAAALPGRRRAGASGRRRHAVDARAVVRVRQATTRPSLTIAQQARDRVRRRAAARRRPSHGERRDAPSCPWSTPRRPRSSSARSRCTTCSRRASVTSKKRSVASGSSRFRLIVPPWLRPSASVPPSGRLPR